MSRVDWEVRLEVLEMQTIQPEWHEIWGREFLLDYTAGKEKGDFRPRPEGILPDQVLRDGLSDGDPL